MVNLKELIHTDHQPILQASHPSTPPIPLSRKITIGSSGAPRPAGSALKSGSEGSLNSENEENESPAEEDGEGEEEVL